MSYKCVLRKAKLIKLINSFKKKLKNYTKNVKKHGIQFSPKHFINLRQTTQKLIKKVTNFATCYQTIIKDIIVFRKS